MAVKSSVRPGSASVCLVGGIRRQAMLLRPRAAALRRCRALLRPSGRMATATASPQAAAADAGALASSARAPAHAAQDQKRGGKTHVTRRRETKSHAVCSLRRPAIQPWPADSGSNSATIEAVVHNRKKLAENHNPDSIA